MFLFSPFLLLQSLLSLVFVALCAGIRLRPIAVVPVSVAVMAFSYYTLYPTAGMKRLADLRARYPMVSVSDRLHYETRKAAAAKAPAAAIPLLSEKVAARLERFESADEYSKRNRVLEQLHDRAWNEFAAASGFGSMRMGILDREIVELPAVQRIPLPDRSSSSELGSFTTARPGEVQPPAGESLDLLHIDSYFDFLDPDRLGYVRDRDHVAGFISHRFTRLPTVGATTVAWQVTRLELIGLLKHEVPVAYVAKTLPNMDELHDAPTRSLDQFEQEALPRLRADEDVLFVASDDRIRMLGSLPAAKNCIGCHSVKRGELLGAFSYELVPLGTPPVPSQKTGLEEPIL